MSNQSGSKRSNEVMMLERRIARLEEIIRRIPSRFSVGRTPDAADGASIRETIVQANSFAAEDVVYNNGGTWQLAQANAAAGAAKYSGVVESSDGASFVVVYAGRIELALTQGTTYYLSDVTAGLLVTRATVTQYQLKIPVLRCVSPTTCIVMAARDVACDLETLTAGDYANGGGSLVINMTGDSFVTADSTDGFAVDVGDAVGQFRVSMAGVVSVVYPTDNNQVIIDPANFTDTDQSIIIREINVCDETGAPKKMLVLGSEMYDP